MASEWHSSLCQRQGKCSEVPYVQSFVALSQNPDLRGSCRSCLSVASLSPVPLCLFPSDFLDNPYVTFHIHMISRKGFWGSPWPRSFSYIQKPEGSKTNILKNPLLTILFSQVGRGPSFPHSCKFPSPFRFFWWDKDLNSHYRDNPVLLSADLPLIAETIGALFGL